MLRCTIEIVPHGDETKKRIIGMVEIANVGGTEARGNYYAVLKKTPPFSGALKDVWKRGIFEDEEFIAVTAAEGFDRVRRGSYDLLFKALKACGLDKR